ncbi:hypothetical protein O5551_18500 [Escherichia coli]|nr:hypothetical protein [Escherichia coli]
MPETIELPPEDIRDFVAIQHDADGKIRVKVVEAKKHITSVQRYLTLLRSRYPGKISKFDFTAKWHLNRSQFGIRIDHDLASISDHSLASQSITIWHASDH